MKKILIATIVLALLVGLITSACEGDKVTPPPVYTPAVTGLPGPGPIPGAYIPLGNVGTVTSGTWNATSIGWNYLVKNAANAQIQAPTLGAVQMSGTWTGTGTVGLPAFTMQGAITGNSQTIRNVADVQIATTGSNAILHVRKGDSGVAAGTDAYAVFERDGGTNYIGMLGPNTQLQALFFGDPEDQGKAQIAYAHSIDAMRFTVGGNQLARFRASNFGLGVTSDNDAVGGLTTSGTYVFLIKNGTAPAGGTLAGAMIYATGGKLFTQTSGGTSTAVTMTSGRTSLPVGNTTASVAHNLASTPSNVIVSWSGGTNPLAVAASTAYLLTAGDATWDSTNFTLQLSGALSNRASITWVAIP